MNTLQENSPQRELEIRSELSLLQVNTDALEGQIKDIAQRLVPVSRSLEPKEPGLEECMPNPNTPIGQELRTLSGRIAEARDAISVLTNLLEV